VLDESSVWNELLELADLEKSTLKKLSSEDKIEAVYEGLLEVDCAETDMSFEQILNLKGESSKKIMGAV